ncbi:MAG: hypothetical protein V4543_12400 [Bacteroidota bacterium]
MIFSIEFTNKAIERDLKYLAHEHSFYMEPEVKGIWAPWAPRHDFELNLNTIALGVIDKRIVNVSGFCGLNKSMKSDCEVPAYRKGILKVENEDLDFGSAFGIPDVYNHGEFDKYVNLETGWVCIGYPDKPGTAVEFISNCVAVINENNNLVALWLKPEELPEL